MNAANTGELLLQDLDNRSLLHSSTDRSALARTLRAPGVGVYVGFDPTADSLHVGHLLGQLMLRRFQMAGHRPFALAGGATGMVGDPSGRSAERNLLDADTLGHNVAKITMQLHRLLDFEPGLNQATLVNNMDWTGGMSAIEFLRDLGKHFTVAKMLDKDSVSSRMDSSDGISFTEFSYSLLQANDFKWLRGHHNVELQMGGSDQWGNIVAGTDLIRRTSGVSAHGLVWPLVTKSDGTKFGKTADGAVWLDGERTSVFEFRQFWMNLDDRQAGELLPRFSLQPFADVEALLAVHAAEPGRRHAQRALAHEMTVLVHGEAQAKHANDVASLLFAGNPLQATSSVLADAANVVGFHTFDAASFASGIPLVRALVETGLCSSNRDARTTIGQHGVHVNGVRQSGERDLTTDDIVDGRSPDSYDTRDARVAAELGAYKLHQDVPITVPLREASRCRCCDSFEHWATPCGGLRSATHGLPCDRRVRHLCECSGHIPATEGALYVDKISELPIIVFDTSTLVADPEALSAYPNANLVLPLRVVEELDGLKKRDDEVGWLARRAIRTIEQIRVTAGGSLAEPVALPNGATLQVVLNGVAKGVLIEFGLDPDGSDNRIIGTALGLANKTEVPVCVVSNDAAFRIKAAHLGLDAREHQVVQRQAGPGFLTAETDGLKIDQLYSGTLAAEAFDIVENEYIVLKAGSQSGLGRRQGDTIVKFDKSPHAWGAKGRNVEQRMALDLLLDPEVPIVALDGPAGTGKSLLAIAAGLEQAIEQKLYNRISIFRSLVSVGREDVGFLPGDLAQKTQPHFAAVHDTVCALSSSHDPQEAEKLVDGLLFSKKLTLEPVSFLRGRSLAMTYIVVDEAQNLEIAVLKTLLTRVAAGTKIIFLGDTSQIDNPFTSQSNNALTALIDAFSGQPMFGHIRLSICERSAVAGLAADLL